MSASPTPLRRAFSSGFACVLCAACATYVEEPVTQTLGVGGSAGESASAGAAGSQGEEPTAGASAAGTGGAAGSASGAATGGLSGGMAGLGGGGVGGMAGGGAGGKASGGAGGVAGGGAGGKASGGAGGKASGGSGGAGPVQTCAQKPIPAKSSWKLAASHSQPNNAQPVSNAHDGDLTNRWSSGKDQSGDEWLQIDFGVEAQITKLTLVLGASDQDYPRMYQTRVSNTALNSAGQALLSGSGQASTDTVMSFPKGTRGRYVYISQHGSAPALWWSVAEIQTECVD